MVNHSAGFMLIMKNNLPDTPVAFQQYVDRFFKEGKFQGTDCFMAFTTSGGVEKPNYGDYRKGVAPSHSVELMSFKEGLSDGENLNQWIDQAVEEGIIFQDWASWNDGCGECAFD